MLSIFKEDFWTISRERKGYYSWVGRERWRLFHALGRKRRRPCLCYEDLGSRDLVDMVLEEGLGVHPVIDLVFQALVRAESRLSLRFIPQGSGEERLTGNLVSEIEAALHLVEPHFSKVSENRYGEKQVIDFFYYDLSRGSTIEKETGADLGFILLIELPDWPPLIRYAGLQAKKVHGSSNLPKDQFDALTSAFGNAAYYVFYDTDIETLLPPMVLPASELESLRDKEEETKSFSVSLERVDDGLPLSLWLLTQLATSKAGTDALTFEDAFRRFTKAQDRGMAEDGRLAILSVGRPLQITRDLETGLRVAV